MGNKYSTTDCCDWSPEFKAIYIAGNYSILEKDKKMPVRSISYPLSRRQKIDLGEFFKTEYNCITDFSRGLIVYIPEGISLPRKGEKVMLRFTSIMGIAQFYLQPIDVLSELADKLHTVKK